MTETDLARFSHREPMQCLDEGIDPELAQFYRIRSGETGAL
jgi:hypothetical protein